MAIAFTGLANNQSQTDASSYALTSSLFTVGRLYIISCATRHGTLAPNVPTASSASITWVEITNTQYDTSGSQRRLTAFRGMPTATVTEVVTIDYGGQTQTGQVWAITEVTGINNFGTSGAGAVKNPTANQDTSATVATITVTLPSTPHAENAVFACFGIGNGEATFTAGSGFTELTDQGNGAEANIGLATFYDAGGADTTADATASANTEIGGIAFEVVRFIPRANPLIYQAVNRAGTY